MAHNDREWHFQCFGISSVAYTHRNGVLMSRLPLLRDAYWQIAMNHAHEAYFNPTSGR